MHISEKVAQQPKISNIDFVQRNICHHIGVHKVVKLILPDWGSQYSEIIPPDWCSQDIEIFLDLDEKACKKLMKAKYTDQFKPCVYFSFENIG